MENENPDQKYVVLKDGKRVSRKTHATTESASEESSAVSTKLNEAKSEGRVQVKQILNG